MKKIKLFLAACAAMVGVTANAVTIDTDLTGQFASLTQVGSWTGASGYTATNFCPMVEVGGGIGQKQVCERYAGNCNETGDIFYATVNGLSAGTYRIELYGGAAYTFGRGFTSTAFSEGTWNAGDKIDPAPGVSTGVTLYAQSEGTTYGGEIPIYYATNFPDGAATVTIEDVVVGASGSIKIGMSKTSTSTNWHVIQLKSVTATVDADAALAVAVNAAKAIDTSVLPQNVADALTSAISTYDKTYSTAEEYKTAINALNAATANANIYVNAKPKLDGMKALVDATNFYTTDAYNEYYGQWALKYDNGTLTASEANALQNPNVVTGWHEAITADNFLLSVWDVEPDFAGAYYINTWSNEGAGDGSNFTVPFFEYWTEDGKSLGARTLTATVPSLEAGQAYNVEIWARVRQRNGAAKTAGSITMQVGEGNTVDLTAGAQVGSSQFYLDHFTAFGKADANGNLVVKINVAADNNISWLSFKNVKYTKVDDIRVPMADQLAALVAEAQSLSTTLAIPSSAQSALAATAQKYEGKVYTDMTEEEFTAAIAEVQDAIATANGLVAPYAAYTSLKGYVEALLAVEYVELESGAHATLEAAASEGEMTSAAAITAATDDLKAAAMTYVAKADPATGKQFDLTFLLNNPDVTSYWTGAWGVQPAGWYTDNEGNFQVMANEDMGPGGEVFMEFWSGTAASNNFVLCQKVTLPEGTYQFGGRVGLLQYDGNGSTANVTFSANDQDGSQIAYGSLQDASAKFLQTSADPVEVKVGLKAHAGNNARWMGINKIQLFKIPAEVIEISEDVAYTPEAGAGTVNLTRTFKTDAWNTFVVPFAISNDDLKAAFGNDVEVAEFSDEGSEAAVTVNFNTMATPAITANKPVLLKTTNAGPSFTFVNRTVAAGEVKAAGTYVDFVGTYAASTTVAEGNYFISADKLWKSTGATTLKGTRAYIDAKNASSVKLFIGGIETAISEINGDAAEQGAIFNLAGQRVNNAQKGIYIVGGKKVLVK